jgi:AraC family transcriptional regulator
MGTGRSTTPDTMSDAMQAKPALDASAGRKMSWLREPLARQETALLRDSQIAAWAGFRVGLFAATTIELRDQQGEHPALGMILRGRTRARIRSRGDECDFCPGADSVGLFGPTFEVSWTRWDCEPGAQRMMVELDFSDLKRADDLDAMLPERRTLRQDLTLRDTHLASLMRLIAAEVREGSPNGALYATSLSLALAAYVFNAHGTGGRTPVRERGMLSTVQKARVLETVARRLADDLTLEDLAAAAGASRFHFLRLFKNTLGMTPHRYVLEQRLAAAKRLLEETNMPLAQIASETGFSSQSHLCTAMRRACGVTPGQWRRES